jgi:hypothetical protein
MKIMSLDTATVSTGYALFEETGPIHTLYQYGLIKAPSSKPWRFRNLYISNRVKAMRFKHEVDLVVMEFPESRPGPAGMQAWTQGTTIKLAHLCGQCDLGRCELVTPTQWKGQLPKKVTLARCNKQFKLGLKDKDHDIADAIMLGAWWFMKARMEVEPGLSKREDY